MPELPEVEVLVRHLRPCLENQTIRDVRVERARTVAPTSVRAFRRRLVGATFAGIERRGKYLLFTLQSPNRGQPLKLLGHLGMTGRMFVARNETPLPKHTPVVLDLGRTRFVFEDTRYFGKFTLDLSRLERLGPEPFGPDFTVDYFAEALGRSAQAIKVKLLDQSLVAGIGNIYASEALFCARLSPFLPARALKPAQILRLWTAIRDVLRQAIECGSTVPLNYAGVGPRDGLFYFGSAPEAPDFYEERLRVYDREGQTCTVCSAIIRRQVQAARSTFYCPRCQRGPPGSA